MIRYAILLINMLGVFIYQLFVADNVSVQQTVPAEMKPGNEYTVELAITKGSIGGFAKLQQELPEGCTASALESKGASFAFSGKAVKFIWTSLPGETEFKITYKVTVAANAPTGEKTITGKFFYVTDNVKQSVEIPEAKTMVGTTVAALPAETPKETVTETPVETPKETVKETPVETPKETVKETPVETPKETVKETPVETPKETVTETPIETPKETVKETPVETPKETVKETTVETPKETKTETSSTQTGGALNCTRTITATGSGEYTVELAINRGSITGFGKIQENLPAGFTATPIQSSGASFGFADQKVKLVWVNFPSEPDFKVQYKLTGKAGANTAIDGLLSYIENDETKKYTIVSTPIVEANVTAVAPEVPAAASTPNEQPVEQKNPDVNLTPTVPQPAGNVNYKVQICALRKAPVDATYFTNKYAFGKVDTELHEGWTKYTVGGFGEYKQARDNREDVRSKGVVGPFVTAYNNGKRITVQEALMITSQKWFK